MASTVLPQQFYQVFAILHRRRGSKSKPTLTLRGLLGDVVASLEYISLSFYKFQLGLAGFENYDFGPNGELAGQNGAVFDVKGNFWP